MHRIGPVTVHVRRQDVAAVAASLGLERIVDGRAVPWTFPAIWLAHPVVRHALLAALRQDEVPFHESQEFSYSAGELAIDASLLLEGSVCREESSDKIRIIIDLRFLRDQAVICHLTCRLIAIRSMTGAHPNAVNRP
jgi:hypothetical protein